MTTENGNGELRQLIELKRNYRTESAKIQDEIKRLVEQKKQLKVDYIERAVDIADRTFPEQPEPVLASTPAPASPQVRECPECGATVEAKDKFCSQCASSLKEHVDDETTVASAGSRLRPRRSP